MNARRIPFQFSTTDPVARQKELEKRFGLQPTCPKMYVDVNNPLSMGTTPKEISSPRLQHRVPIFAEGYDHPLHSSSVDSMASVPENKKPNVRVIPIEVEGAERSPRHRTYSGPAGIAKDCGESPILGRKEVPPFKRLNFEDVPKQAKPKLNSEPKVFNIPIRVEGSDDALKRPQNCANKTDPTEKPVSTIPTSNGCSQSKVSNKAKSPSKSEVKAESKEKEVEPAKNPVETELKKIEDVLNEFKTYETGVSEFTGTSKDKQYRYLDEMLTRCMLKLDEIDTMGNEQIRLSRKSAVKKIQASIDLLESKANVQPVTATENNEKESAPDENVKIEVVQEEMANDNSVSNGTTDNKSQSEVLDNFQNQETDTSNEMESLKTEEKCNVTDVEMCDALQDKTSAVNTSSGETTNIEANPESKISSLSEDTMQADEENTSLQQQQCDVPEIEMSEETSSNNAPLLELRSENNGAKQDLCETVIDVEMSDVKDLPSNSVEKSCDESPKSNEVLEVEMGDTENNSSGKKESVCRIVNKSDCVTEKTDDAVLETVTELSQDIQSVTSQSGNAESIDVNNCSNNS